MPVRSKPQVKRKFVPGGTGAIRQMAIDEMELVVDNFAGGGGASTGIALAIGREVDIAINHDPDAIAMHEANHPHTRHYTESVWDVDPVDATQGRPVGLAWFSPDCTHFSRAKGSKPVKKEIRGLAWVIIKWAALVGFRVGMMENVEEFKTWGPIDETGFPIKERAGETFKAFVLCLTTGLPADHPAWEEIREVFGPDFPYEKLERGLGYCVEFRPLRACDFGAPTIRTRLFGIIRRDGRPIVWPQPTHGDPNSEAVKSGRLLPWHTAADIIDWSIPCRSIFGRKKPLAENTLKRIARGIWKFVINNPHPFIVRIGQTGYGGDRMQYPIDQPLTTVTSKAEHLLVVPSIDRQFGKSVGHGVNEPLGTVTAGGGGKSNLVAAFLTQYHGETGDQDARGQTLDRPIMTVDTSNRYGLAALSLAKHFGGGYTGSGNSLEEPLSTVTATDHNALVSSHLIKLRGTCADGQPVTEPMPTITAGGNHIGEVRAFLVKYYGDADNGQSLDSPLHTITSKDRFGLITVAGEDYQIVDIGMRMLKPRELFDANGFPKEYKIELGADGREFTQEEQVARCGNAVPPQFSEALVRANLPEMCVQLTETASD